MNKVILLGNLARDPEVRYTQTGKAVASFTIAVSRGKDAADFVPIVAWEKLAEICGNNITKGSRVLVEGRLQIRSYDAADGQKRRVAEVIAQNIEFLSSRQPAANTGVPSGTDVASSSVNSGVHDANSFGTEVFPDEEIPF